MTGDPARLPAQLAGRWGQSIVPAQRAQRTNQGRTPFICTSWVPISLSFNSQQGPALSSLSVSNPAKSYTTPCEIFCCFPTVNCPYLPAPGGGYDNTVISDVCPLWHHLLAWQKAWARNGPSISRIENVSLGFKIADCLSSGIAI